MTHFTNLNVLDGHKMNISVLTQITIPDHPEDETFRKLTQKPFDVVADAVAANNLRDYKGVDSDFIIKCYGWTVEEYAREWNRRNPD